MKRLLFLIVSGLIVLSCTPRTVTTPQPATMPSEKTTTMEGMEKKQPIEKGTTEIGGEEVAKIETAEIQEPTAAELSAKEREEILKDIHFDFDKYDIRDQDKPILRKIADWLLSRKDVKLIIEGHCDERGTNEYNLGLGDKRATATKDYLVSLGVPENRLQTVSYGEERPICTEHNESCWQQNRRAHFVVIEGGR
jgi:peptidoglycan-associated lipoprotein